VQRSRFNVQRSGFAEENTKNAKDFASLALPDFLSSDYEDDDERFVRLATICRVRVLRPNQDRGRGAGFIPQEREHRTDAPAKFQSLLRSSTPLRTEVRAPSLAWRPRSRRTGIVPGLFFGALLCRKFDEARQTRHSAVFYLFGCSR